MVPTVLNQLYPQLSNAPCQCTIGRRINHLQRKKKVLNLFLLSRIQTTLLKAPCFLACSRRRLRRQGEWLLPENYPHLWLPRRTTFSVLKVRTQVVACSTFCSHTLQRFFSSFFFLFFFKIFLQLGKRVIHTLVFFLGDGIGPEIVQAAQTVIGATGVDINWHKMDMG